VNETDDHDASDRDRVDEGNTSEREPVAHGDESLEDFLKPWSPEDFRLDLPTNVLDLDGNADTGGGFGWGRGE
jgi:hypothetical protein